MLSSRVHWLFILSLKVGISIGLLVVIGFVSRLLLLLLLNCDSNYDADTSNSSSISGEPLPADNCVGSFSIILSLLRSR